jgi:hypothetical protein
VCGLLPPVLWASPAPADTGTEVCSSRFVAYQADTKVPKKQRQSDRERAEDRAFLDLAQQAFASGTYHERMEVERQVHGDSDHPGDQAYDEEVRLVQAGRKYYGVNELLHGGTYRTEGDSSALTVWYCLPTERFDSARAELLRARAADVGRIRDRLAGLERGLARDDLDWAAGEMSALLGEVQSRVMETETYTSPLTGNEKTFRGWLVQWRSEIQRGTDYAMQLLEEANDKVKEGHLKAAGGLLDEAEKADPTNPRARQLRLEIEDLRARRAALLKGAADKAALGKIAGARSDLDEAERIDLDDQAPLLAAREAVERRSRQFLAHNPRVAGDVSLAFGGLGADVEGSADAFETATGNGAHPDLLLTLGLGVRVRLGRYGMFLGSGGYGYSDFKADSGGTSGDGSYKYDELSAGLGFRTIRTERRHASFVALGGVTREHVSIGVDVPGFETSDARRGEFARFAVEWRRFSMFVQHGFGFGGGQDSGSSLVRWHDGTQFGLAFIY